MQIPICFVFLAAFLQVSATLGGELTWLSSYDEALVKAKKENKPILLQFRCVPCINGREFDAKVVYTEPDSARGKIMQQYVLARISSNTGIDIAKYDRDWHNSLYYFVINADETIYLRYGGRDGKSASRYLNLDSFQKALKIGLKEHSRYLTNKKLVDSKKTKAFYPKDIALLNKHVIQMKRCVECHLIADYRLQEKTLAGFLDPIYDFYQSPDINALGIFLDIPQGVVISKAHGAAANSGLKAGDLITRLNGKCVLTFGDLQYHFNKVNRYAQDLSMTVKRGAKEVECRIALPKEWWKSELDFRHWSNQPRLYFQAKELSAEEKAKHGLEPDSFASVVEKIEMESLLGGNHQLKVGDIILAVNHVSKNPLTTDLAAHIILNHPQEEKLNLLVKRAGKIKRMQLTPGYENFRKVPLGETPQGLHLKWSKPISIESGRKKVVTYRATLVNGHLLIQVRHRPGWSTFSMDNEARMIGISGKKGEQELPTKITLDPVIEGEWLQSDPVNFSRPDIKWYSWGFQGVSYFAKKLAGPLKQDLVITINAQGCDKITQTCAGNQPLSFTVFKDLQGQNNVIAESVISTLVPLQK